MTYTTIEFGPKMRQPGMWGYKARYFSAPRVIRYITPEQAQNDVEIPNEWNRAFWDKGVNLVFAIVPNGAHLPIRTSS